MSGAAQTAAKRVLCFRLSALPLTLCLLAATSSNTSSQIGALAVACGPAPARREPRAPSRKTAAPGRAGLLRAPAHTRARSGLLTRRSMAPGASSSAAQKVVGLLMTCVRVVATLYACWTAFSIRTMAIKEYGRLIHECVPAAACHVRWRSAERDMQEGNPRGACPVCLALWL
jgi:hypothetical protein